MEAPVKKEYECHNCGSMYYVIYDPDEVELKLKSGPELCPFCGSSVEEAILDESMDTGLLLRIVLCNFI